MIWFVLAVAMMSDRGHWPAAALMVLAVAQPWAASVAVVALVARARHVENHGLAAEIRFHQHIISELRGGSALRTALASASSGAGELGLETVGRRLRAGQPIDRIAETIGSRLAATGDLAAAAIEFSVTGGGRAINAFEAMAEMAAEEADLRRELSTAVAPGRFALLVVGGGPVAALILLALTGRLTALLASTRGPLLLGAGLVLIAAGVAIAVHLSRGALR